MSFRKSRVQNLSGDWSFYQEDLLSTKVNSFSVFAKNSRAPFRQTVIGWPGFYREISFFEIVPLILQHLESWTNFIWRVRAESSGSDVIKGDFPYINIDDAGQKVLGFLQFEGANRIDNSKYTPKPRRDSFLKFEFYPVGSSIDDFSISIFARSDLLEIADIQEEKYGNISLMIDRRLLEKFEGTIMEIVTNKFNITTNLNHQDVKSIITDIINDYKEKDDFYEA